MIKNVTKSVEQSVHTFIQRISDKYNLEADKILSEWEGVTKPTVVKKPTTVVDIPTATEVLDPDFLLNCKKPELQALCRQRGLKCTGTKPELIGLLVPKTGATSTPSAKAEPKPKVSAKSKVTPVAPVAAKLKAQIKSIKISRNQFGNYEFPETGLVFNQDRIVIGKQQDDGTVDDLTEEDIDVCNRYKLDYVLPGNLDRKTHLNDIKVTELEEDLEDEDIIVSDQEDAEEEEVLEEEELIIEDEEEDEDNESVEEDFDDYE
jgi:hypothetical protein